MLIDTTKQCAARAVRGAPDTRRTWSHKLRHELRLGLQTFAAALALVSAAIAMPGTAALAQDTDDIQLPTVSVLVDSSRAMGLVTAKRQRMDVAKDALAAVLQKYDRRIAMSLAVYGHKKRDRCLAVDVVKDIERLEAAPFAQAVASFKPEGSAPVALALDTIATSLAEEANARDLVIIAASRDTCLQDPCKAAAAVARRQPDLRVSVIGIGEAGKTSASRLQCVAQTTGGQFTLVKNAQEAAQALDAVMSSAITTAVASTGAGDLGASASGATGNGWSAVPSRDGRSRPAPELPTASQGRGTVRLVALLTDGEKPIPGGLTWRIFTDRETGGGRYQLVTEHREWSPVLQLPTGNYLVNAAYGRAHLTRRIRVTDGTPRLETFVLQAGGMRLRALDARGQPLRSNVTYSVLSGERDQFGNRRTIIANVRPGLVVRLNAGIYNVVSRHGDANAIVEADVTVEPGKLTEIAMTHLGGTATFKLVARPGGEAIAGTSWSIRTPDGTEIKSSLGALPSHVLAPGDYIAFATLAGRTFGGQFSIAAGDNKQIEIVVK
ncbi:MAG: hypothetical protein AAFQ35_09425 [Pseudomonadota bacterium]